MYVVPTVATATRTSVTGVKRASFSLVGLEIASYKVRTKLPAGIGSLVGLVSGSSCVSCPVRNFNLV